MLYKKEQKIIMEKTDMKKKISFEKMKQSKSVLLHFSDTRLFYVFGTFDLVGKKLCKTIISR